MRFSLEHLEAFSVAAAKGSFSAAARTLGKAQSRISSAIASLEADLGVTLFDRSAKYPVLTREGELLLCRAEDVLRHSHGLMEQADTLVEGGQISLRLAVDELLPAKVVALVLQSFAVKFPHIALEVLWGAMGDVASLVQSGRAEVGVDMPVGAEPSHSCSWKKLASAGFCGVACPEHILAGRDQISTEDLEPHLQLLAISREGTTLPDSFRFGGQVWQCEDSRLIRELVLCGVGWSVLPRYQVAVDLEQRTMVELPLQLDESGLCNSFFFLWGKMHTLTDAEDWLADRCATVLQGLCGV